MARIFFSYRRAEPRAGRIADRLNHVLGDANLFVDVDDIPVAEQFAEVIGRSVQRSDVLVAVIGPRWIEAKNESGQRRIDDETDYVRLEIAAALKSNTPVIPVLVGGAQMPTADELPQTLRRLSGLQAIVVEDRSWPFDVGRLVAELERVIGVGRSSAILNSTIAVATVALLALGLYILFSSGFGPSQRPYVLILIGLSCGAALTPFARQMAYRLRLSQTGRRAMIAGAPLLMAATLIASGFAYGNTLDERVRAEFGDVPLDVAWVLCRIKTYDDFRSDQATELGARRIFQHLGLTPDGPRGPEYVTARIRHNLFVTAWWETYNQSLYGFRYGAREGNFPYFGSNDTYFEIPAVDSACP